MRISPQKRSLENNYFSSKTKKLKISKYHHQKKIIFLSIKLNANKESNIKLELKYFCYNFMARYGDRVKTLK